MTRSAKLLVHLVLLSLLSSPAVLGQTGTTAASHDAAVSEAALRLTYFSNERRGYHPQPRSYDTHHYYAIELTPGSESESERAQRAADALGAEIVERVGELKDHWLVRSPKLLVEEAEAGSSGSTLHKRYVDHAEADDPILKRWRKIQNFDWHSGPPAPEDIDFSAAAGQRGKKRSNEQELDLEKAKRTIRDVERQTIRRRFKRDKIIAPWTDPQDWHRRSDGEHDEGDRLPWKKHIPAPKGAVPDPRDDPDFLAFAPEHLLLGKQASTQGLQRNPYSKRSSLPVAEAEEQLDDRKPPPIPDSPSMRMEKQFDIHDPIFGEQWHLANDKKIGNDLNVSGVWSQGVLGKGVTVALIDDGLDMNSDDLKDNFYAKGSYDFNNHVPLPEPRLSDDQHGTRCAGEIAAIKNDRCGVGVAHKARVAGLRILSGPISDVDEAAALNYGMQDNHIYSCSWGPPDDGRSMDAPKGLIAKAMLNGVQNGRGGKGSIFVFAGGNGGASDDQCNFDGYTNSIYSITIAAVDRKGQHPYYSEMCSANLATSWSSGAGDHIHTTDVTRNGVQRCTASHGGTSAAAPLIAGVVALGLGVRPEMTWRDVQHVAVRSAVMINPDDKDWQQTQAGRHYNHKYGYGLIDAYQFVEEAKRHKLVKPQAWLESPKIDVDPTSTLIEEGGVSSLFNVTKEMMEKHNLEALEHVTVHVWISHERRGDIQIELTSPHGTKSVLARPRRYDEATTGFPGWGFMSLKHWDEDPVGTWRIEVFDRSHPKQTGNFWGWTMTLWGASIDPSLTSLWSFPADSKEAKLELPNYPNASHAHDSLKVKPSKPTDHLPTDHGVAEGESHVDFTNGKVNDPTSGRPDKPEADTGYLSGLRKHGSTWLFVAAGVVFIFAGTVVAFFVMRRKRNGAGGAGAGDYEFVPAEDDVAMGSMRRDGAGGAAGAGGRARTKELYDAFGDAPSDDDDDAVGDDHTPLQQRGLGGVYRDDEEEGDTRFSIGGPGSAITPTSAAYRDDPERDPVAPPLSSGNDDEKRREEEDMLFDVGDDEEEDGSGGSGSWQDAKPEA